MDAAELRDQFKRQVLPVLAVVDNPQVVNVVTDLDLRVDDLWAECRSAVRPDDQDLRDRVANRVQRVYALLDQLPEFRPLLRTVYAYGTYMNHHGRAVSPYVLISAAQLFTQELQGVRLMPTLR